jgi:hypothetical protein
MWDLTLSRADSEGAWSGGGVEGPGAEVLLEDDSRGIEEVAIGGGDSQRMEVVEKRMRPDVPRTRVANGPVRY